MAPSSSVVSCKQHAPRELNRKEEHTETDRDFLTAIPRVICMIVPGRDQITSTLIKKSEVEIKTAPSEDRLALNADACQHHRVLCACHMLINPFYLLCLYRNDMGKLLLLFSDKTREKLRRNLFCTRDT